MAVLKINRTVAGKDPKCSEEQLHMLSCLELLDLLAVQTRELYPQCEEIARHVMARNDAVVFVDRFKCKLAETDSLLVTLKAKLSEKDQLLYELFACAHAMLQEEQSQQEVEFRYMEELLADHFLGGSQVAASVVMGETELAMGAMQSNTSKVISTVPDGYELAFATGEARSWS